MLSTLMTWQSLLYGLQETDNNTAPYDEFPCLFAKESIQPPRETRMMFDNIGELTSRERMFLHSRYVFITRQLDACAT